MEKAKGNRNQWLTRHLDFISPHELSKCVSLFERTSGYAGHDARLEHSDYVLSVQIVPVDDDIYRFSIDCRYRYKWSLFSLVTANGYLKRWGRKSTHVFGKVEFPITYCVLLTTICTAFACMGLVAFVADQSIVGLLAAGVCLITFMLQWRALNDLQGKLADVIATAVHPMPESVGYRRINLKWGQPRRRHHS